MAFVPVNLTENACWGAYIAFQPTAGPPEARSSQILHPGRAFGTPSALVNLRSERLPNVQSWK